MAKFYGRVGYGITEESEDAPGVWEEKLVWRNYYGDILRTLKRTDSSSYLNDNINVTNEISILADPFALNNFSLIHCIEFMGAAWKVNSVEIQYPRLILSIGGVYNAPEDGTASNPCECIGEF